MARVRAAPGWERIGVPIKRGSAQAWGGLALEGVWKHGGGEREEGVGGHRTAGVGEKTGN